MEIEEKGLFSSAPVAFCTLMEQKGPAKSDTRVSCALYEVQQSKRPSSKLWNFFASNQKSTENWH